MSSTRPASGSRLHQRQRLVRPRQRETRAEHGANVAVSQQLQAEPQFLARGAGRTEHRNAFEKELCGIERHELAGQLPDEHPATAPRQRAACRREHRRADGIEHAVDALAIGQRLHVAGEIAAARREHHRIGTQFPQRLDFRRGCRLCDHPAAGTFRKLHAMHAETAARAGHHHDVARCNAPDGTDGVQHGADRTRSDRSLVQRHVIGNVHHIVRFDRDELGVSAIQPGISEEDLLGAQRLTSAATEAALATDRLALGGGDAIADGELLHRTADCDHGSGDLVTRHAGQHDTGAQCAGADGNVVRADAAESDPNDHIAWPGHRIGDSLADQGAVEVAGLAKNERAHSGGLTGLPSD